MTATTLQRKRQGNTKPKTEAMLYEHNQPPETEEQFDLVARMFVWKPVKAESYIWLQHSTTGEKFSFVLSRN